ncbi:MAG: tryptophan--tRNA ligase [Deltaproteobacteria bacterium RIFOXYA12_FULL_58_15]|nr:MAG: tryptophan--tRNA ligase [Deltaproteobacteria bacterium RIFOXYA12_FULL_58_15]
MPKYLPRVLSGMRPTGPLHLGHYFGALENWVRLQNSGEYACWFFSADWHALTTGYRDTSHIAEYRRDMFATWMAVGLDPDKATFFAQAALPEHGELATLFGMITPIPWLERVPSYKEVRQELSDRDLSTIGFLNYPLLQTADITMYLATHVPVGEDQLAHVELSREVVRRFNSYYGEVFPEPKGLVTKVKRLPGLDNRKMSKSYGNAIYLTESPDEVKKKVMPAPTDPARIRRSDPGTPEKCTIYAYQAIVQEEGTLAEIAEGCRTAAIGCVDCKKKLLAGLEGFREPIRAKHADILASGDLDDIIVEGNRKARAEAQLTMHRVREVMGL